ncbi:MAG: TetR family transcriptional regulator C-terminal domain-containing protein [Cyclobacteriaceae bacterium]
MATATAKKKSTGKSDLAQKIRREYMKYRLENGTDPTSIYSFATQNLKIEESQFYEHYNSFLNIESGIWLDTFKTTEAKLLADKTFQGYSAQEKLLALFYTLFEDLKTQRSFFILSFQKRDKLPVRPKFMDAFYDAYTNFIKDIINQGAESGEISKRPESIQNNYYRLVWGQFIFLFDFWVKDTSKNFEDTDAAIEKSVNLLFELVGKNIVDNVFDFAKFLIQRR